MNDVPVATCFRCGGVVAVPKVWAGTMPPPPTCSTCGAVAEPALPVVNTRPPQPPRKLGLGLWALVLPEAPAEDVSDE